MKGSRKVFLLLSGALIIGASTASAKAPAVVNAAVTAQPLGVVSETGVVDAAPADPRGSDDIAVVIHKSQVVDLPRSLSDVFVGNPDIADVLPVTDRSFYVLGKTFGSTSITVYDESRELMKLYNVTVTPDVASLQGYLKVALPEEDIRVLPGPGNSLMLKGTVSNEGARQQALQLVETFSAQTVDLLDIESPQQVRLDVRFSEITRSAAKALGLNVALSNAETGFSFGSGDYLSGDSSLVTNVFGQALRTGLTYGAFNFDVLLEGLERKGAVRVLAEPSLMALSGESASFLAGGEYPVPVQRTVEDSAEASDDANAGDALRREVEVTLQFREFGVRLEFTPNVRPNNIINLTVEPEVSSLDSANAVTFGTSTLPGLTTRKAKTTVELRDGESFAIAGLLRNNGENLVRQLPFLGDIPILGALFRSSEYQRSETELVIIVTPHLVKPSEPAIAHPVERYDFPTDLQLFGMGKTLVERSPTDVAARRVAEASPMLIAPPKIAAPHGHLIR